jgi:glycosyltransferase involved in cell wall biosynthesis
MKQEGTSKVVVIFPTKNEEGTIEHVVRTAKKSRHHPEVIVVDAYSSDKTARIARDIGARVIQQDNRMFPAKGIAMKKGLKEAISTKANIVLFLDADIKNLTPEWIDKLVDGCINCDMVRGYYQRHGRDAPVTKLIAKPMIRIFFPELSHFEQPLSGEVCARIQVWKSLLKQNPPDGRVVYANIPKTDLERIVNNLSYFDVNPSAKTVEGSIGIEPNKYITLEELKEVSAKLTEFMDNGIRQIIASSDGVKSAECRNNMYVGQ